LLYLPINVRIAILASICRSSDYRVNPDERQKTPEEKKLIVHP